MDGFVFWESFYTRRCVTFLMVVVLTLLFDVKCSFLHVGTTFRIVGYGFSK